MDRRALLIYDGACPMCQRARKWVEARVPSERLEIMACQDTARPLRAPMITEAECLEAMQLILSDGRHYAGEKAFPPLLRMMRWGRYVAWLFALPGAAWVYRRIARNRLAISALLFRKKAGERCSIEDGCE